MPFSSSKLTLLFIIFINFSPQYSIFLVLLLFRCYIFWMEPLTSYLFPFVFHLFDLLFYFLKDFPDFIFYTFYWYFKFSATLFLIFKNCFLITVHYFVWVFLLILWMHLFLFSLWGYQSMFCFLLKIILLSAFSIFSWITFFSVCFCPSLLILGSVFMFEC